MATSTIGQLTLAGAISNDDLLEIEVVASNLSRKISRLNLIGATLTGGGTVATGGFTLTIPATGTAGLLGTAQTFSALKTFSAGLTFGGSTLSTYAEAQTFTPQVADAASGGNLATMTTAAGFYTRIGNRVWVDMLFDFSSVASMTSGNQLFIRNLPFASYNSANYRALGQIWWGRIGFTGEQLNVLIGANVTYLQIWVASADVGTNAAALTVGALAGAATDMAISISYLVA